MPDPQDERFLPAPYHNPWQLLQRDGVAVVADLRLRVQELWRRNRQGDLQVPAVWPRDLAPLFWPLLVGLVALLLVGAVVLMVRLSPLQPFHPPDPAVDRPVDRAVVVEQRPSSLDIGSDPSASLPPSPDAPNDEPGVEPSVENPVPEVPTAAPPASAVAASPDPLVVMLQQSADQSGALSDATKLVLAADLPLERNAVDLTLGDAWWMLSHSRQQQLAELWLEHVQTAGYDALLLQSDQGEPWGHSARVGWGMVLEERAAGGDA
ncbi:MAG: hypothetical protein ACON4T_07820 [Synechococcus sp.]